MKPNSLLTKSRSIKYQWMKLKRKVSIKKISKVKKIAIKRIRIKFEIKIK
jgi:hypothetical protein